MKLSILIPSLYERSEMLSKLYKKLEDQLQDDVEILTFIDNRQRSIGEKRDNLLKLAKGDYFTFLDDDDGCSLDYIPSIMNATRHGKDLILYNSQADIDGKIGIVEFDLSYKNEQFRAGHITKRQPFHMCTWKRKKFQQFNFPHRGKISMYGEDWAWCKKALTVAKSQHKIDKILHYYYFKPEVTRAY